MCKPLVQAFYGMARKLGMDHTFPAEYGPAVLDNQQSVNKAGVPMMDLIDFEHLDHWHNQSDTYQFCSADSLGKVGRMMEAWLTRKPVFEYPKK